MAGRDVGEWGRRLAGWPADTLEAKQCGANNCAFASGTEDGSVECRLTHRQRWDADVSLLKAYVVNGRMRCRGGVVTGPGCAKVKVSEGQSTCAVRRRSV